MPETNHTDGPWYVGVGKGVCFHSGNYVSVCATEDDAGEEIEVTIAEVWPTNPKNKAIHDGLLMAASPKLLAVCQKLANAASPEDVEEAQKEAKELLLRLSLPIPQKKEPFHIEV